MPEETGLRPSPWRSVPNAISIARIAAAPVLLSAVVLGHRGFFKWLLLTCLLSDILDGLIARSFHLTSKLGASLDSVADILTMFMALAGIAVFQKPFVAAHYPEVLLVVVLYAVEMIAALVRYGKVSSFHTLLDRIAAYMAGIFIMSLFLWGYQGWLFHLTVAVFIAGLSEELVLIYLLQEWRSDVGGLYRVLSRKGARF